MSATPLIDNARRETGLEDFGSDSFREGLAIYVESLDERFAAYRRRYDVPPEEK